MGHQNNVFETYMPSIVHDFYLNGFRTCLFLPCFSDNIVFCTILHPFWHHFGQHAVSILTSIFKHNINNIRLRSLARRPHPGPIEEEGGTRWSGLGIPCQAHPLQIAGDGGLLMFLCVSQSVERDRKDQIDRIGQIRRIGRTDRILRSVESVEWVY